MKINLEQTVNALDGTPIKTPEGKDWMLRDALVGSCFAVVPGDNPNGDEKYKRWKLANKIQACPDHEVELSIEEMGMVKKLCGACYHAVVVGAIWSILEK